MIGKRDIVITIVYTSDYTNGVGEITDFKIKSSSKDIVEYPMILGVLDMAKEKFIKDMGENK